MLRNERLCIIYSIASPVGENWCTLIIQLFTVGVGHSLRAFLSPAVQTLFHETLFSYMILAVSRKSEISFHKRHVQDTFWKWNLFSVSVEPDKPGMKQDQQMLVMWVVVSIMCGRGRVVLLAAASLLLTETEWKDSDISVQLTQHSSPAG